MKIGSIHGATRVLGEAQGYQALPVADQQVVDPTTGNEVNVMHTAWHPTEDECLSLLRGAPIVLSVYGINMPPVLLTVGATNTQRQDLSVTILNTRLPKEFAS